LVRHQQKIVWAWVTRGAGRKQKTCEKANPQEAVVHNGPFFEEGEQFPVSGSVASAATIELLRVLRTRVVR